MRWYQAVSHSIHEMVTHPVEELTRWQRGGRFMINLGRHCARQLYADRAEEMAAALAYRTIFSLIPLLVMGLAVFKMFGALEEVQGPLQEGVWRMVVGFDVGEEYQEEADENEHENDAETPRVLDPATESATIWKTRRPPVDDPVERLNDPRIPPPAGGASVETSGVPPPAPAATQAGGSGAVMVEVDDPQERARELAEQKRREKQGVAPTAEQKQDERQLQVSYQKVLTDLIARVSNLSFASIGVVGAALFIYAGMGLMIALEDDLNIIFKSERSRPWHLRVPIYWSMITLGSGMLGMSFYMTGQIVDWVDHEFEVMGPLLGAVSRVVAFMLTWVMLFLLFTLMPNTKVRLRAALIGSFTSAALWEIGKFGFQAYVRVALPYSNLYGVLGLLPLFMFWVYVSWVIVLFGLELTYALQMMREGAFRTVRPVGETGEGGGEGRGAGGGDGLYSDPRWLIPLVAVVGRGFESGEAVTLEETAKELGLPVRVVDELARRLRREGLVHLLDTGDEGEDPGLVLAMPPGRLAMSRVVAVGRGMERGGVAEWLRAASQSGSGLPGERLVEAMREAEDRAAAGATLADVLGEVGGEGGGGDVGGVSMPGVEVGGAVASGRKEDAASDSDGGGKRKWRSPLRAFVTTWRGKGRGGG